MTQQEIGNAFGGKVTRGIFKPVARHITNLPDQEDRLQEAICMTYEMAARYAGRGTILDDAILVHSCRQRATDLTRRFVKTDAQPRRDVLSQTNYRDGRVEVLRLDGLLDEDGDYIREQANIGLADATTRNPTRSMNSALDLGAWLKSLGGDDQELLAMRIAGHTLQEIADHLGRSISTVFSRLRTLGLELADRAGVSISSTKPLAA